MCIAPPPHQYRAVLFGRINSQLKSTVVVQETKEANRITITLPRIFSSKPRSTDFKAFPKRPTHPLPYCSNSGQLKLGALEWLYYTTTRPALDLTRSAHKHAAYSNTLSRLQPACHDTGRDPTNIALYSKWSNRESNIKRNCLPLWARAARY